MKTENKIIIAATVLLVIAVAVTTIVAKDKKSNPDPVPYAAPYVAPYTPPYIAPEPTAIVGGIVFTKSKLRENFNGGCAEDRTDLAFCNCMFDTIFNQLGMQGFADMAAQYDKDGILPSWSKSVIINCMGNTN